MTRVDSLGSRTTLWKSMASTSCRSPERHRAELRPSSIELSAVDGRMTWSRHSRRIDPIPTSCPACQSSSIGTTAKIPDADNDWRCENCGEVWNASRSQTDWYRGQRWR
ncbi:MAG: hypothetical protein DMG00_00560 [Acidobacteria bacterium]|nr:MAG: hypothetical protein DMG00_00560 [Acidobacteriota bacterium]